MPRIKLHGSVFDTHLKGVYEVQSVVNNALRRYKGVVISNILDSELHITTNWPTDSVNKIFYIRWMPPGEVGRNPAISTHSNGEFFFLPQDHLIADVTIPLLKPDKRALITYSSGDDNTHQGFAIEGKNVLRVEKKWVISHSPCYGLHTDALYWETGRSIGKPTEEDLKAINSVVEQEKKLTVRKLNIQGMGQ